MTCDQRDFFFVTRKSNRRRRLLRVLLILLGVACALPLTGQPLGSGALQIAGTRLAVEPAAQTVPFDTPTVVTTTLEGYDLTQGALPPSLRVVGELSGPEIQNHVVLETVPGEPFRIPRLRLEGEYFLSDIRLLDGDELLAFAEPREVTIRATQILVSRVSSRALTLDELRGFGVVFDEDNFQAFNLTFGFGVDGDIVNYDVPVVTSLYGPGEVRFIPQAGEWQPSGGARFQPPQLVPFSFAVDQPPDPPVPTGGCPLVDCRAGDPAPPMVGVILFPTDVRLLNQFFSVVLMVQNGAPEADPLIVRDLTARIVLPSGLRQAETEPPTPLGVPVPVRVPGSDGELGTADDVTFLVAQASGEAEFLVEGLREGSHIVEFQLEGLLEGLPSGLRRITGSARGAVVVRDPSLGVTISHPEVVRDGEPYPLRLTVANTGNAPVNLLSLELPTVGLSGVELAGDGIQTVDELLPGDSATVQFDLIARRTGKVIASAVRSGGAIDPRFELTVGVGENGIPLSPDTLVLPATTEELPSELVSSGLGLLGLGYSLATAPPESLAAGLPRVGQQSVTSRVYSLTQAGRHVALGEELFDAVAVLAAEWNGARDRDWEWDLLHRSTRRGGETAAALGAVLASEAAATTPLATFERFAATTHFLPPQHGALVVGDGVEMVLAGQLGGQITAGRPDDPDRRRELPFAELFDLGGAEMALLSAPEESGYEVRLGTVDGGSVDLHLLTRGEDRSLRLRHWTAVSLPSSSTAWTLLGDTEDLLHIDDDGDGEADRVVPATASTLAPRPFSALSAVQNAIVDPSGHVVDVLFSSELDPRSLQPSDPARFELPGKVSNGGRLPVEQDYGTWLASDQVIENPFAGLHNPRIIRVVFDNPISPLVEHELTVRDLLSSVEQPLFEQRLAVDTRVTTPGVAVEGTVIGPDGQPVPFAEISLYERDTPSFALNACQRHRTAAVRADAAGRFRFDYVRDTCGGTFEMLAEDSSGIHRGKVRGQVRFIGDTQQLDIVMMGRGRLEGQILYDDGTVPPGLTVVAENAVFSEGRLAHVAADGRYDVGELVVGTISMSASDAEGNVVFATVELPHAGSVVDLDLTLLRRPEEPRGEVRGSVVAVDGTTPLADAWVALYVGGELIGVERSDAAGDFDFGIVPTGVAQIEAFHGENNTSGGQIYFEVLADQINQVQVVLRDDRGTVEGHVYRQGIGGGLTPVVGAVVWISGLQHNTVTDSSGYYRLDDVFGGSWRVNAVDVEQAESTSAGISVSGSGETFTADLYFTEELPNGGIRGQVLSYDGSPVLGAAVHLAGGYLSQRWHHEAVTDGEGRFVIEDIGPGSYGVHAVRGADGALAFAEVRFQGDTPFVTVRFEKGTIRGQTLAPNDDGEWVGVTSTVVYRTTVTQEGLVGLAFTPSTLVTEADGTFELPETLVGPYQITVHNAFYGSASANGTLVAHGDERFHEIRFEPNGSIRGVVLDIDGQTPVEGVTMRLRGGQFNDYDVETDADGRFAFELVPPAFYWVEAEYQSGVLFRQQRVAARLSRFGEELDIELVLPQQGSVVGRVEDSFGSVVPGAVVTLQEGAYPGRRLVSNADGVGEFRFDNIFAGNVSVRAQAPSLGGLGGIDSVEIVNEGEEVEALIVLQDTGEITGRVLSPVDGSTVASAQVSLFSGHRYIDSLTSDGDGAFRFRLLPLANYWLRVLDPASGRHGQVTDVRIDANGQVLEIDVTLEGRGVVRGSLFDDLHQSVVAGATVKLNTQSIAWFTTYSSTDIDGLFEFGGIPEGEFRLDALEPDGFRHAYGSGEIEFEDQEVTVDLVLQPVGVVRGQVLAPPGAPPGLHAGVNTRLEQSVGLGFGGPTSIVVGATVDNPYEIDGVLTDHRLKITTEEIGGIRRAVTYSRIPAGETELELDLQLEAAGSVTVSVVDGNGPVHGVDVTVFVLSDLPTREPHLRTRNGNTGADHTISFDDIRQGWVEARVTDPVTGLKGRAFERLDIDGSNVLISVQLEASGSVAGRVLAVDGVTPVADAIIALGESLAAYTEADGTFMIDALRLGTYDLSVQDSEGPGRGRRAVVLDSDGQHVELGDIVLDDVDPLVVAVTPASGSHHVPRSQVLEIEFSEPMDTARSTSAFKLTTLSGGNRAIEVTWSGDGRVATMVPLGGTLLDNDTGYHFQVRTTAVDLSGRPIPNAAQSTFFTADQIPPTVIEISPADGAVEVPVASQIAITFSESVAIESLSGSALQLLDETSGDTLTTTFLLREGEREVLLQPVTDFEPDRRYRLTVQGVADPSGNTMTSSVTTTFWTPDTTPPQVDWLEPALDASVVSGDAVAVRADVSDLRGVEQVTFTLGEWSTTFDDPPYEWTVHAPAIAVAGPVEIVAEAVDVFGNLATSTRVLQVTPQSNASAPEIDPACLTDGDFVAPGLEVPFDLTVTDDVSIESIDFWVDGQRIEHRTPIDLAEISPTFLWTPPADATVGTTFALRFEARDYAGNVGVAEANVTIPAGQILSGDQALDSSSNGIDLVLAAGQMTVTGTVTPASLKVLHGARLQHADSCAYPDWLATLGPWPTGSTRVQCGAVVEVCRLQGADMWLGDGSSLDVHTVKGSGVVDIQPRATVITDWLGTGELLQQGDLTALQVIVTDARLRPGSVTRSKGSTFYLVGPSTVEIDAGAQLDFVGQGFRGDEVDGGPGSAPGVRPAARRSGGSHGGYSSFGLESDLGELYGSVTKPYLAGAAGGENQGTGDGEPGGGSIWVIAGDMRLDGEILVNGASHPEVGYGTGGAGGSVMVQAQSLVGSGRIEAAGGEGYRGSCWFAEEGKTSGGGGGGRVALHVEDLSGFDPLAQISVAGGPQRCHETVERQAGAGSIYVSDANSVYGTLYLPGGDPTLTDVRQGSNAGFPHLVAGEVSAVQVSGSDLWITPQEPFQGRWFDAWMVLFDAAGESLGTYHVVTLDWSGRGRLTGAAAVADQVASYAGEYRFDAMHVLPGAAVEILPSRPGLRALWVEGDLEVAAEARLDVSARGFGGIVGDPRMAPDAVAGSSPDAGGSHGGSGTVVREPGPAGEVYDSVYWPTLAGGGGAIEVGDRGAAGGATLWIEAGRLVLDGSLEARGEIGALYSASRFGAGAGGTVRVVAGEIVGAGSIDVSGGASNFTPCCGFNGLGGGGRVALEIEQASSLDALSQLVLRGGEVVNGSSQKTAAPGTGYVMGPGSVYGDLFVLAGDQVPELEVTLPVMGSGEISVVEVQGSDLWIEPSAADPLPALGVDGMWARVADVDYRVLAQSPDRRRMLLEGAAGVVTVGETYRGVYKFDTLSVRGGAEVRFYDLTEIAQIDVDAASQVILADFEPPALGAVTPADGSIFAVGQTIPFSAEATDDSDLRSVTLTFDGVEYSATAAPFAWDLTAPVVAVDTPFTYSFEAVDGHVNRTLWSGSLTVSADAIPPTIGQVLPAAGTTFQAGDEITVTAEVTDDYGVQRVTLSWAGQNHELVTPPWSWSVNAPPVDATTSFSFDIEAEDTNGNLTSISQSLWIEPTVDPLAPVITSDGCPRDGDLVRPGEIVAIRFTAEDSSQVYSYGLSVDGQSVATVEDVFAPVVEVDLAWTVPSDAVPGQSFVLTLEAEDLGGRRGTQTLTVAVSGTPWLTGDQSLDGQTGALVLGPGSFTLSALTTLDQLTLMSGARLTSAATGQALELSLVQSLRVQCGGSVDVSSAGFPGATLIGPGEAPEGVLAAASNAGGSHGGRGTVGHLAGLPGEVYDSVYLPQHAGGSGGVGANYDPGGSGGGALMIEAGSVILDGELVAVGGSTDGRGDGYRAGAGAGGTVVVMADSLVGGGSIDASGGSHRKSDGNQGYHGGAAGGGRVALWVDDLSAFDPSHQVHVEGGEKRGAGDVLVDLAAPGTLFTRDASAVYGTLWIDGEGVEILPVTQLPALGEGTVELFEVAGQDAWLSAAQPFASSWLGVWVVLIDASGSELGAYSIVEIDAGRVLLEGAATVSGAASYRGEYRFDGIHLSGGAHLESSDPLTAGAIEIDGLVTLPSQLACDALTLRSGARVLAADDQGLDLEVSGPAVIEAGAMIDLDGRGFLGTVGVGPGAAPDGIVVAEANAGGSHGGLGIVGDRPGEPGDVFDSVYRPALGGGSGAAGHNYWSGAGGGVLTLTASSVVLDGEIRARGESTDGRAAGYRAGAGAGGSVVVVSSQLSGSGMIDASGGNHRKSDGNQGYHGGAAGGGRVALWVDDLSAFDVATQVQTFGGEKIGIGDVVVDHAAPGTLYTRDAQAQYGELWIDGGQTVNLPQTPLPVLGVGSVSALEIQGTDAWLTAESQLQTRWDGAWMVLLDAMGVEIAAHEVLEIDDAGRALLAGAAGVSGAASYRGEYRFDAVQLRGGANLQSSDRLVGGAVEVIGEVKLPSRLEATDVILRAGTRALPQPQDVLALTLSGTLTIESGAVIDVSGWGFPGGPTVGPGTAPVGILASEANAGGSHGGAGTAGNMSGLPGEVYGSVYAPDFGGGSGGVGANWDPSGNGGGVVLIDAQSVVLHGDILARGISTDGRADGYRAGAGAGGTVSITAATLHGLGTIDASGGSHRKSDGNQSYHGGAGGGGRVALWVDDLSTFDPAARVQIYGGEKIGTGDVVVERAAPGTLYTRTTAAQYGELWIDGGQSTHLPPTSLPTLGDGDVTAFELQGADAWVTVASPLPRRWVGAWMVLVDAADSDLGAYVVLEIDEAGRALLAGAAGAGSATSYRGEYRFDGVQLRGGANLETSDPLTGGVVEVSGEVTLPSRLEATTLTVRAGARVVPQPEGLLALTIAQALTVEAGAVIDASGWGYPGTLTVGPGSAPIDVVASQANAGGSHGGSGTTGNMSGLPGAIYGSIFAPDLGGGGGGAGANWDPSGAGGGAVLIVAQTVVLDGDILVRGVSTDGRGDGYRAGAGAGGTVSITAASLQGQGIIDASGGSHRKSDGNQGYHGGAGGGGRVALWVDDLGTFDVGTQVSATGGEKIGTGDVVVEWAAPGTLFIFDAASIEGRLRIDGGQANPVLATELPPLGSSTVVALEAVADDAWLSGAVSLGRQWLGATAVLLDGADLELGRFRVLDVDAGGRILLADAASVGGAVTFRGEYRFDAIEAVGGATYTATDPVVLGSQVWQAPPAKLRLFGPSWGELARLWVAPSPHFALARRQIPVGALPDLTSDRSSSTLEIVPGSALR